MRIADPENAVKMTNASAAGAEIGADGCALIHSRFPASLNATSQVPSGALANFEEVWQEASAVPLGS